LYYYLTNSTSSSLLSLPVTSFTLSPLQYKVVEMNDRLPFFKLATTDGAKPYADGDRAQMAVINSLQLVNKCQQDPSFIVVDVGAFLGTHTCTFF
jgi:hypothetical protein